MDRIKINIREFAYKELGVVDHEIGEYGLNTEGASIEIDEQELREAVAGIAAKVKNDWYSLDTTTHQFEGGASSYWLELSLQLIQFVPVAAKDIFMILLGLQIEKMLEAKAKQNSHQVAEGNISDFLNQAQERLSQAFSIPKSHLKEGSAKTKDGVLVAEFEVGTKRYVFKRSKSGIESWYWHI